MKVEDRKSHWLAFGTDRKRDYTIRLCKHPILDTRQSCNPKHNPVLCPGEYRKGTGIWLFGGHTAFF